MHKISDEDWAELTKLPEPTVSELIYLAQVSGVGVFELDGRVLLTHQTIQWNPIKNLDHNHKLLQAVIAKEDCKLFYDDGVNEYFFYKWNNDGPPIAHRTNLNEAVIEAAMNLWFPKEE